MNSPSPSVPPTLVFPFELVRSELERIEAAIVSQSKSFDPALEGYWGNADHMAAMETCLAVIRDHAAKVDGIKISLLEHAREVALRDALPTGVLLGRRSRTPLRLCVGATNALPDDVALVSASACTGTSAAHSPSVSSLTRRLPSSAPPAIARRSWAAG